MDRVLKDKGKAKTGLHRRGRKIYLTLLFPSEYDAIKLFDVWSLDDIDFHFKGPKVISEKDAELEDV